MAVPFSLRLDEMTRRRLEDEARRQGRPASQVASRAIVGFLDAQDELRRQIETAVAEADQGAFISSEAMHGWMDSWGSDRELPPPEPDIVPTRPRRRTGSDTTS
jgi:predicted transcriptional regulator